MHRGSDAAGRAVVARGGGDHVPVSTRSPVSGFCTRHRAGDGDVAPDRDVTGPGDAGRVEDQRAGAGDLVAVGDHVVDGPAVALEMLMPV